MKKIILLAMGIVLMASVSFANPFLVCDPQANVTLYKFSPAPPTVTDPNPVLPSWMPTSKVAEANGSLRLDVGNSTVGVSRFSVSACWTTVEWGEQCSAQTPFQFTRPASPTIVTNIKLTP